MVAVLKTVDGDEPSVGSNPTSDASTERCLCHMAIYSVVFISFLDCAWICCPAQFNVALSFSRRLQARENTEHDWSSERIYHCGDIDGGRKTVYRLKWVRGEHVEVFLNGIFLFSADTMEDAHRELELRMENFE